MKNLIKVELFKLKKNYYIITVLIVMILLGATQLSSKIINISEILVIIEKDVMVMLIALSIYSSLTVSNSFGNRTIMHCITNGHRRSHIILANFLEYYIGCFLIILLYPMIIILLMLLLKSLPILNHINELIISILKCELLYLCFIRLFFSLIHSLKKELFQWQYL